MIAPSMINIGKLVFDFMELHPNIETEIISSPYDQDLIVNGVDVAFRLSNEIEQENLVARELGNEPYGLVRLIGVFSAIWKTSLS